MSYVVGPPSWWKGLKKTQKDELWCAYDSACGELATPVPLSFLYGRGKWMSISAWNDFVSWRKRLRRLDCSKGTFRVIDLRKSG